VRDDIYLVDVIARARNKERAAIDTLQNLQLPGRAASPCRSPPWPASAMGWSSRRSGAARACDDHLENGDQRWRAGADRGRRARASVARFVAALPPAIRSKLAARSRKAQGSGPDRCGSAADAVHHGDDPDDPAAELFSAVPGLRRCAARIIGVVAALLPSHSPMGFVAILGILALIGILIRNSVILIIQIETLLKEGVAPWDAVREATQHRMRPIMLTRGGTLALIPISREIFWGDGLRDDGGIIVGTMLTLLFLPALYLAWSGFPSPKRLRLARDSAKGSGCWTMRRAAAHKGMQAVKKCGFGLAAVWALCCFVPPWLVGAVRTAGFRQRPEFRLTVSEAYSLTRTFDSSEVDAGSLKTEGRVSEYA